MGVAQWLPIRAANSAEGVRPVKVKCASTRRHTELQSMTWLAVLITGSRMNLDEGESASGALEAE